MAGCYSVQGKKWSKLTHFQPLSWFQTVSGSNQLLPASSTIFTLLEYQVTA